LRQGFKRQKPDISIFRKYLFHRVNDPFVRLWHLNFAGDCGMGPIPGFISLRSASQSKLI
jgi:hypothetical protein